MPAAGRVVRMSITSATIVISMAAAPNRASRKIDPDPERLAGAGILDEIVAARRTSPASPPVARRGCRAICSTVSAEGCGEEARSRNVATRFGEGAIASCEWARVELGRRWFGGSRSTSIGVRWSGRSTSIGSVASGRIASARFGGCGVVDSIGSVGCACGRRHRQSVVGSRRASIGRPQSWQNFWCSETSIPQRGHTMRRL